MRRLATDQLATLTEYEKHLNQAVDELLRLRFPRGNEGLVFDKSFWKGVKYDYGGPDMALELKLGRRPFEAIDALFADVTRWKLDCARFVQVAHWYAMRHTLGHKGFDKFIQQQARNNPLKAMVLLPEGSTGILTQVGLVGGAAKQHFYKRSRPVRDDILLDSDNQPLPLKQVHDNAPLGSCISFRHLAATLGEPFYVENTLRLGPDTYAAHGYGQSTNKFTQQEVIDYLDAMVMRSSQGRLSDEQIVQARQAAGADSNVYLFTIRYYDIKRMGQF